MKILSIGSFKGLSNTCVHRNWALQNIAHVDMVDMYDKPITLSFKVANKLFNLNLPVPLPDYSETNNKIYDLISKTRYDIVWIDKGWLVNKITLKYIKKKYPHTIIVSYSPDNMALRHNQSQNYLECIPFYDCIFTNKSYILEDMKKLGAKNIYFVNNSYEEKFHYPRSLTETDLLKYGGDVGFIGAWEKERCESILFLADHGIQVKVFGDGKWKNYKNYSANLQILEPLFSEIYSKALQAFKISICFLRKMNDDRQTTRTMEIPACGGFMLAERTEEHKSLFEEGKEAAYFASNEELLEKCRYYLNNEQERIQIALNGHLRCQTSGYDNAATIKKLVNIAIGNV